MQKLIEDNEIFHIFNTPNGSLWVNDDIVNHSKDFLGIDVTKEKSRVNRFQLESGFPEYIYNPIKGVNNSFTSLQVTELHAYVRSNVTSEVYNRHQFWMIANKEKTHVSLVTLLMEMDDETEKKEYRLFCTTTKIEKDPFEAYRSNLLKFFLFYYFGNHDNILVTEAQSRWFRNWVKHLKTIGKHEL